MVERKKIDLTEQEQKERKIIMEYEESRENLVMSVYDKVMNLFHEDLKHSEALLVLEMCKTKVMESLRKD